MRIHDHIASSKGAAIEMAEHLIELEAEGRIQSPPTVKDISGPAYRCGCGETPGISMNAWINDKFYCRVVLICPNCSEHE